MILYICLQNSVAIPWCSMVLSRNINRKTSNMFTSKPRPSHLNSAATCSQSYNRSLRFIRFRISLLCHWFRNLTIRECQKKETIWTNKPNKSNYSRRLMRWCDISTLVYTCDILWILVTYIDYKIKELILTMSRRSLEKHVHTQPPQNTAHICSHPNSIVSKYL